MLLHHYSPRVDLSVENVFKSESTPFKPGGLWLSDDSNDFGWESWCRMENFHLERLKYRYPVGEEAFCFRHIQDFWAMIRWESIQ